MTCWPTLACTTHLCSMPLSIKSVNLGSPMQVQWEGQRQLQREVMDDSLPQKMDESKEESWRNDGWLWEGRWTAKLRRREDHAVGLGLPWCHLPLSIPVCRHLPRSCQHGNCMAQQMMKERKAVYSHDDPMANARIPTNGMAILYTTPHLAIICTSMKMQMSCALSRTCKKISSVWWLQEWQ